MGCNVISNGLPAQLPQITSQFKAPAPVAKGPPPPAEKETPVGDQVTLQHAVPTPIVEAGPAVAEAPVVRPASAPPPRVLTMEMGEVGAGLLSAAPMESKDGVHRNTVGWAGEPTLNAPFTQTHRVKIQQGMDAMDRIAPGLRQRMDQLLAPDATLVASIDAVGAEQAQLLSQNGKLLALPDHLLSPQQKQQKEAINARVAELTARYEKLDSQLSLKNHDHRKQAQTLAKTFLHRLRQQGAEVGDVSGQTRVDQKAADRLQKDEIATSTFQGWVNEFHHQTGMPAPKQPLKFTYNDTRPNYLQATDTINIGDKFSKRMALHEIAHRLEYQNPEISLANKQWVAARNQNSGCSSEPTKLQELVPKGDYKKDEVAFEDHFIDPYVGKKYSDAATEVLSVGLEHFADDKLFTKLYQQDPEHLFLTLGAIETARKGNW